MSLAAKLHYYRMRIFGRYLVLMVLIVRCSVPDKGHYPVILPDIRWENCDLRAIQFDSNTVRIPNKRYGPLPQTYQFQINGDILTINNRRLYYFNATDIKDSISILKFSHISKDSFKLTQLNNGAKELFKDFSTLTFYNSTSLDRFTYYKEKDQVCQKAIDSALHDIRHNKYVYHHHALFTFRNENEFAKLLNIDGIGYLNIGPPIGDDDNRASRNCYQETMNYFILKKFGEHYIQQTLKRSDSLLSKTSGDRVFEYDECDVGPHLKWRPEYTFDHLRIATSMPIKNNRKEWIGENGKRMSAVDHPVIDLGFQIDTAGHLSNFRIKNFIPELEHNKQFKDRLFQLAIFELQFRSWSPGTILGEKVNSNYVVRCEFYTK